MQPFCQYFASIEDALLDTIATARTRIKLQFVVIVGRSSTFYGSSRFFGVLFVQGSNGAVTSATKTTNHKG